jgi:hypothetical protein
MTNMAFGVRQVRDFLSNHGHVLTVRGYDYGHESATVIGIGRIHRKNMGEITTIDDIKPFVTLSGFTDVRDWWQQIKKFCKGRMWLYRVQIDDSELDRIGRDAEKIEQQRLFAEQNAWSNEEEIAEITGHPLDVQDSLREFHDSFMIDLQPHRDAVHEARMQRDARQAELRRERMRERAGEQQGQIKRTIRTGA